MTITRIRARAALACLAATAALLATTAAIPAGAAARTTPALPRPGGLPGTGPGGVKIPRTRPPGPRAGQVAPLWRLARGARPGRYPGQHAAPNSIGEPGGYDPGELRAYLGLHGTGAGQTVVVTEAYNVNDASALTTALGAYDSWYGLPPACSATVTTGCFQLTFAAPGGTCDTESPPTYCIAHELSWELEAELDVELIHALVPQASITVAEGYDQTTPSMMAALDYAQGLHPAVVSNSWGGDEFSGEQADDSHCPATGAPCVFSSGDNGTYPACLAEYPPGNTSGVNCAGYPAASPDVLAVGGTTLDLAASGKVVSQSAWSSSGGGISADEPFPAYQKTDPYTSGRGVPDVSFDANPQSGIAIYYDQVVTYEGQPVQFGQGWTEIGGTSVGSPAWAAILASAAQLRAAASRPPLTIRQIHAAVYAKAARKKVIADTTTGTNGICGPQCSAGPGYDLVTGQGSPRPGIDTYLASR